MSDSNAIVPVTRSEDRAIYAVKSLSNIMLALRKEVLIDGVDYGIIPGTGDKPTLFLPGMEKVMRALNAVPEYIERCVIRDYNQPLFHYEYECRLVDADTGMPLPGGRGLGLCTSMESSFAWRWVDERFVPEDVDKSKLQKRGGKISEPAFAIEKAETTGKYGKPEEYWQAFKDAIENSTAKAIKKPKKDGGTMDAWEIDSSMYRILNPDIYDQLNAIIKRAKKRALGDAVKGAASISEFFTVDVEDFVRYDDTHVIEGEFTEVTEPPKKQEQPPARSSQGNPESSTPSAGNPPHETKVATTKIATWATESTVKALVSKAISAFGVSDADVLRYAGIDAVSNYVAWNTKYVDRTEAGNVIKAAYNKELEGVANEPPAQPKSKPASKATHVWTEDEIADMDLAANKFWDPVMLQHLEPAEALRLMEKKTWSDFGDPQVAIAALRTMCIQKVFPIVASAANYLPKGKKYSELTNGILDVQKYGLREELEKQGEEWATYVETWEKGESYTFRDDEMPDLIVTWTLDKGTPTMASVNVLELTF